MEPQQPNCPIAGRRVSEWQWQRELEQQLLRVAECLDAEVAGGGFSPGCNVLQLRFVWFGTNGSRGGLGIADMERHLTCKPHARRQAAAFHMLPLIGDNFHRVRFANSMGQASRDTNLLLYKTNRFAGRGSEN